MKIRESCYKNPQIIFACHSSPVHGSISSAMKFTVKSTSRSGSLLVDDNHHSYYKKKENFYVCTEYKKEKANCPVTGKIDTRP